MKYILPVISLLVLSAGVRAVSQSATESAGRVGMLVTDRCGHVCQISVRADSVEILRRSGTMSAFQKPRMVSVANDRSRNYVGADYVLPGPMHKADIMPYTGRGVVLGIIDSGIDPDHITFQGNDGKLRVARYIFTHGSSESGDGSLHAEIYSTPDEISSAPADTAEGGHGTHTAATAAGSWRGNPYAGVAPETELVFVGTGVAIYDDEVIYGMRAVSDYAASVGKPAVMSLSLGSGYGPRDGTSPVGLVSKEIADKGHMIVFAAGNDGQRNASIQRDFSRDTTTLRSMFAKFHKGDNHLVEMEAWSSDRREAEIQIMVAQDGVIRHCGPWFKTTDATAGGGRLVLLSDSVPGEQMSDLRRYFQGEIFMEIGEYSPNGRFRIALEADIKKKFHDGVRPTLAFAIRSPQGADMRIYSNPAYNVLASWGNPLFTEGHPGENISDFASSPHVVSAGMINAAESVTTLAGETISLESMDFGNFGEPNRYTSYGTTLQGERLPHVLAPGSLVVSALYPEAPGMESNYVCDTIVDGRRYVWGHDSGTSMATPMVAGIIALWLEALPQLRHDDIVDILAHSSNGDVLGKYPRHCRFGTIDAYTGLKYALATYNVAGVVADSSSKLSIRFTDGCSTAGARIECLLSSPVHMADAAFYSLDGRKISSVPVRGAEFETRLPDTPGVYMLRVAGDGFAAAQKLIVTP